MSIRPRRRLAATLVAAGVAAALITPGALTTPSAAVGTAPITVQATGCPTAVPSGTLRDGSASIGAAELCRRAVAAAATPQAALAIQAIFRMLGAPYACGGVGRMAPFRFDCSSLVSRAYFLGAGLDTAGTDWAPSTRDMVPWDGVKLASWAAYVAPKDLKPGDLVLYDTGGSAYRHVVMYIGSGFMLHTNSCGDVAHVSTFWGFPSSGGHLFLVARRVMAPAGWVPPTTTPSPAPKPTPAPPPTPGPPPAYPGRALALGSTGEAVAAVQRGLIRGGYLRPEQFGRIVSGTFGSQTRDAVAAYQYAHPSLGGATGTVNAALYRSVTGWAPPSGASTAVAEPGRPLVSASAVISGNRTAVKVVQAALNRVVGARLSVDGQWGPRTQAAFTIFRHRIAGQPLSVAQGPRDMASLTALGRVAGLRVTL